jgi:signal transduction histidine kinase/ligand-binding sensor domain-containing protein
MMIAAKGRRVSPWGKMWLGLGLFCVSNTVVQAQPMYTRFNHLTTSEGLSSDRTRDILRDSRDFIWIATDVGLDRYDSHSFRRYTYRKNQPGSLSAGLITFLFEDSRQNLWIGTTAGLNLYDRVRDNFKHFQPQKGDDNSLKGSWVTSITEDPSGNLLIVTDGNCLNLKAPGSDNFKRYPFDSVSYMTYPMRNRNIDFDSKGNIWLTGAGDGIFRFDPKTEKFERFMDPDKLLLKNMYKCLYVDDEDVVWIGTGGNGLVTFDPVHRSFFQYNSHGNGTGTNQSFILDMIPEDGRHVLIATDHGGINRLDKRTGRFTYFMFDGRNAEGLNNNGLSCLLKDREGILWVGTSGGGVNYYNPNKDRFRLFRHNSNNPGSLVYNAVSTFCEDHTGHIWVGTDGGGISVFDPVSETFTNYVSQPGVPGSLSGNSIRAIVEDRDHDIWIGSWEGGLDRFDRKTGRFIHYPLDKNNPENTIVAMQLDQQNRMWIVILNKEIVWFDKKKGVIRRFPDGYQSLPIGTVMQFTGDSTGEIWMASTNGVIHWSDAAGSFRQLNFPDNAIVSIHIDKGGHLWVGTASTGIFFCKPDGTIVKHYTMDQGLVDDHIRGITEDAHGNFWISTNNGISRLNWQTGTFTSYNMADGLQGPQFNHESVYRSSKGEIFFGGSNGFNSFYPDSLKENKVVPKVYITEFQIFNKTVIPGRSPQFDTLISEAKTITLNWKQDVFSFGFSAINYTIAEKNRYAYRMEGFEKEWNQTDASRRYVTYTNLDPGTYTFRVIAANNDERWNRQGVALKITILPPWWETIWFRALVFMLLIVGLLWAYSFRVNQLKKQQRLLQEQVELKTAELIEMNEALRKGIAEREKFLSIIAHDLRNPFNSILGFSNLLLKKVSGEQFIPVRQFAVMINSAAESVYNLLNNLLEWARAQQGQTIFAPSVINITEILEDEMEVMQSTADSKNVSAVIDSPDNLKVTADPNMIKTVVRNLISNAIKYSNRGGQVFVGAGKADGMVEIIVRDQGTGMEQEQVDRVLLGKDNRSERGTENEKGTGLGLVLCKDFISKHQGSFHIESEPGKGSTFIIRIPETQRKTEE